MPIEFNAWLFSPPVCLPKLPSLFLIGQCKHLRNRFSSSVLKSQCLNRSAKVSDAAKTSSLSLKKRWSGLKPSVMTSRNRHTNWRNKPISRNQGIRLDHCDAAYALDGNNLIFGGTGNDSLTGGNEADEIHAGAGRDRAQFFRGLGRQRDLKSASVREIRKSNNPFASPNSIPLTVASGALQGSVKTASSTFVLVREITKGSANHFSNCISITI